jgi:GNAT superfamily N-acetyltransferase
VVAEREGVHLGYGEITYNRRDDLRASTGDAQIGMVVVEQGVRGRGVGRRITAALLDWAREQSHPRVVCDWRATNLSSSRAFSSFGWQPTFYRLHRCIPEH